MSVEIATYNGIATDVVWPYAKHLLEGAEDRAYDVNLWEMYQDVLSGTSVLFMVSIDGEYKAAAIGELAITSRRRFFWIPVMGGKDMPQWITELSDRIAEYAEELGLDAVSCAARPGVAARLRDIKDRPHRWRRGVTYMNLEINNHG